MRAYNDCGADFSGMSLGGSSGTRRGVGCREISLLEGTHFLDFVPRESEDSYTDDHGEN